MKVNIVFITLKKLYVSAVHINIAYINTVFIIEPSQVLGMNPSFDTYSKMGIIEIPAC